MALYNLTRDAAGLSAGLVVCLLKPAAQRKPGEAILADGVQVALDAGRIAAWLKSGTLVRLPEPAPEGEPVEPEPSKRKRGAA